MSPFYLMAHADYKYHEDVAMVLAKHDVTKAMYRLMTVLREHEPANIGMLADISLSKRTTVSRMIDRMSEMGLVVTSPNQEDSRTTEVVLTEQGRAMLGKLTPVVGRQFVRAVEGLTNAEIEQLIRTLQRMVANLNKLTIE
jgi:DNA-binding MarR family transcriptional regulator